MHQIDTVICSSASEEMIAMDTIILRLYQRGVVTGKLALDYAATPELLAKKRKQ